MLADVIAAKGRDVKTSWVYPIWGVDGGRHGDLPRASRHTRQARRLASRRVSFACRRASARRSAMSRSASAIFATRR